MKDYYVEFIEKMIKDIRFGNMKISFTEHRRKCYEQGNEKEMKILRIVIRVNEKNGLFLKTHSFRINHILEDNLTEVVSNCGYNREVLEGLNYKKISSILYKKVRRNHEKDESTLSKVL